MHWEATEREATECEATHWEAPEGKSTRWEATDWEATVWEATEWEVTEFRHHPNNRILIGDMSHHSEVGKQIGCDTAQNDAENAWVDIY